MGTSLLRVYVSVPPSRTDETVVGGGRGVIRPRILLRLPNKQRGGEDLLSKIVGTPTTPVLSDAVADELPLTILMDVVLVVRVGELLGAPRASVASGCTRRVYLRRGNKREKIGPAEAGMAAV